jgi:hypothetical protein
MTCRVVGWPGPLPVLMLYRRARHETCLWAQAWAVDAARGPVRHGTVESSAGPGPA